MCYSDNAQLRQCATVPVPGPGGTQCAARAGTAPVRLLRRGAGVRQAGPVSEQPCLASLLGTHP